MISSSLFVACNKKMSYTLYNQDQKEQQYECYRKTHK